MMQIEGIFGPVLVHHFCIIFPINRKNDLRDVRKSLI